MVVFGGRGVSDLSSLSLGGGDGGNFASLNYASLNNNANNNNTKDASRDNIGKSTKGGKSGKDNNNNAANNLDENGYPQAGTLTYANTPLLMNDFGVFDLASSHWQIGLRVEGLAPPARYGHSVVATQNHIIIFGGIGEANTLLNDVWVLSFDKPGTIVWKPVTFRESAALLGNTTNPPGVGTAAAATVIVPNLTNNSNNNQNQNQNQINRASTPGGASNASTSSSPFQPSPRVGSSLTRISKSCVAVACGRIVPEASLVGQNFGSTNTTLGSGNNNITNIISSSKTTISNNNKTSSKSILPSTTTATTIQQLQQQQLKQQQQQMMKQKPQAVSSGVYFLDISKIIVDELNPPPVTTQGGFGSGRGSARETPQP